MHQTKKGNQWYLGKKKHIGIDSKEAIVHSVCSIAASVSDLHVLADLQHKDKKKVWGDAGYQEQSEAIHAVAPEAHGMTSRRVNTKAGVDDAEKHRNGTKSACVSRWSGPSTSSSAGSVSHKVRYRGLKKNHQWLCACFALANLYQHRKRLARIGGRMASMEA